jgi:predicted transcriptional regulator
VIPTDIRQSIESSVTIQDNKDIVMTATANPKPASLMPSKGELRILQVLWELGQATVEDVVNHPSLRKPNYKTNQTLLRIMEQKGFANHFVRGRGFVFTPLVTREQIGRLSVRNLLQQNFGGSPSALLVNLIEGTRIDSSELEELERIIRSYRTQQKS